MSGEKRGCTPTCLCSSVGASLLAMTACQPTNFFRMYPAQLWERACPRRRPDSRPTSCSHTRINCGSELARDGGLTTNDNPLVHTNNVARELAPARLRSSRKSIQRGLTRKPHCLISGPLRSPAGASSLATGFVYALQTFSSIVINCSGHTVSRVSRSSATDHHLWSAITRTSLAVHPSRDRRSLSV